MNWHSASAELGLSMSDRILASVPEQEIPPVLPPPPPLNSGSVLLEPDVPVEVGKVRSCQRSIIDLVNQLEALERKIAAATTGIRESTFRSGTPVPIELADQLCLRNAGRDLEEGASRVAAMASTLSRTVPRKLEECRTENLPPDLLRRQRHEGQNGGGSSEEQHSPSQHSSGGLASSLFDIEHLESPAGTTSNVRDNAPPPLPGGPTTLSPVVCPNTASVIVEKHPEDGMAMDLPLPPAPQKFQGPQSPQATSNGGGLNDFHPLPPPPLSPRPHPRGPETLILRPLHDGPPDLSQPQHAQSTERRFRQSRIP